MAGWTIPSPWVDRPKRRSWWTGRNSSPRRCNGCPTGTGWCWWGRGGPANRAWPRRCCGECGRPEPTRRRWTCSTWAAWRSWRPSCYSRCWRTEAVRSGAGRSRRVGCGSFCPGRWICRRSTRGGRPCCTLAVAYNARLQTRMTGDATMDADMALFAVDRPLEQLDSAYEARWRDLRRAGPVDRVLAALAPGGRTTARRGSPDPRCPELCGSCRRGPHRSGERAGASAACRFRSSGNGSDQAGMTEGGLSGKN